MIRLETDAIWLIFRGIESGIYRAIASPIHYKEVSAIQETSERLEIESLLNWLDQSGKCDLIQARNRADYLINMGFGIADAAHIAFAEQLAEFFITCDDKLLKKCRQVSLHITTMNPPTFVTQEAL